MRRFRVTQVRGSRLWSSAGVFLLLLLSAFTASANAQNPELGLREAEASEASAEITIGEVEAQLTPAEARYAAATRKAVPAKREARVAQSEAERLNADAEERQQDAAAQIAQIESDHAEAADEHNREVQAGLALALAALITAVLAVAWGWFRASAAVAWLTHPPQAQAIGLCVGGGLLLVIIGVGISETGGVIGVLGMLIFLLGFVLSVAFLLARHSTQIQRGRAQPLLKRERMPGWVNRALAVVMAAICLAGLGSAIFATDPTLEEIPVALREKAEGEKNNEKTQELAAADAKATKLKKEAARLVAAQSAARASLREIRGQLTRAERELLAAQRDARYYTNRLAVLTAREDREAELAEIEAEEDEEEEFEPESTGCDPNYTGCVPSSGYDVDCAEVGSSVQVIGVDVYGLDADNDGIGCE